MTNNIVTSTYVTLEVNVCHNNNIEYYTPGNVTPSYNIFQLIYLVSNTMVFLE